MGQDQLSSLAMQAIENEVWVVEFDNDFVYKKFRIQKWFKTSFARKCTMMYQVDLEDFSEFRINAFLSSPGQSILKNKHLKFWVAMVTK